MMMMMMMMSSQDKLHIICNVRTFWKQKFYAGFGVTVGSTPRLQPENRFYD